MKDIRNIAKIQIIFYLNIFVKQKCRLVKEIYDYLAFLSICIHD